jgi:hypothetical protein
MLAIRQVAKSRNVARSVANCSLRREGNGIRSSGLGENGAVMTRARLGFPRLVRKLSFNALSHDPRNAGDKGAYNKGEQTAG